MFVVFVRTSSSRAERFSGCVVYQPHVVENCAVGTGRAFELQERPRESAISGFDGGVLARVGWMGGFFGASHFMRADRIFYA